MFETSNKDDDVKHELIKVGNPLHNDRFVRTEYYIAISFKINGTTVRIKPKVDTGSPYTIIGLKSKEMKEYRDFILPNKSNIDVYDATESKLDIEQYNVTDLKLAKGIIFDKVKLCFSEALGEKSVIGMDILGLFEILYLFNDKHLDGTFYLSRYSTTKELINKHLSNSGKDILYPVSIFEFDGSSLSKLSEFD